MVGKLIVFEGGEGSGKTTQIQKLRDWLLTHVMFKTLQAQGEVNGLQLTREPGGTALGQDIRQLLLTPRQRDQDTQICSRTELLLYAADRAQHVEETIMPWLAAGHWILCDRFTDSTVAYQGYGRQLDLPLIHELNQIATGGLKSDLTLWLNVSPSVGLSRMRQRGEADRMEQAGSDFHQRVCEGFSALARPTDGSPPPHSSGPTVEIDGNLPLEAVFDQIQTVIQQHIKQWYPHLFPN
ncbi:MAG: dTMP kinase [Cyanobacteria bacterium P01_D01_bin.105]